MRIYSTHGAVHDRDLSLREDFIPTYSLLCKAIYSPLQLAQVAGGATEVSSSAQRQRVRMASPQKLWTTEPSEEVAVKVSESASAPVSLTGVDRSPSPPSRRACDRLPDLSNLSMSRLFLPSSIAQFPLLAVKLVAHLFLTVFDCVHTAT